MAASTKRKDRITGKRVAAHRERLGLSRPALAKKLGVDRTHVWRIEEGEAPPSLHLLEQMAALFGVTLDELRNPRAEAAQP